MNCESCGHESPPTNRFCEECGATLVRRCGGCGGDVPSTAKFCGACGASLVAPPEAVPSRAEGAKRRIDGHEARKVVTVVFADLIGSTALHERLDAESVRSLMARYYGALHAVVDAHGGTVVKLLGDGVMAGFGLPRVAEDDAMRAVRAALAMQQAFRALAREQSAAAGELGLRVAVNTGEVVVEAATDDVVGDPINIAARLQEAAQDGDVVIGEATRRLVGALVTLAPLGPVALRGRAETVAAYRVVSLERPAGASAVAFVGRDDELRRLAAVYDAAMAAPAAPGRRSRLPGCREVAAPRRVHGPPRRSHRARRRLRGGGRRDLRAARQGTPRRPRHRGGHRGLRPATGHRRRGAGQRGRPWPHRRRRQRAPRGDAGIAGGDVLRRAPSARRAGGGAAGGARARRPPVGRAAAARSARAPGTVEHGGAAPPPRRGAPRFPRRVLGAGGAREARDCGRGDSSNRHLESPGSRRCLPAVRDDPRRRPVRARPRSRPHHRRPLTSSATSSSTSATRTGRSRASRSSAVSTEGRHDLCGLRLGQQSGVTVLRRLREAPCAPLSGLWRRERAGRAVLRRLRRRARRARAKLAEAIGAAASRQRELCEAYRLFAAMSAPIRAAEIERELQA